MSSCFGKVLHLHRFPIINKTYTPKYFSILTSQNDNSYIVNSNKKYQSNKINGSRVPVQQCRNFSDIYSDIYSFVTTSEASKLLTDFLIQTHDVTGLPWWSTIILAGAGVKLGFGLPCGIFQQHILSRLKLTKLELDKLAVDIKKEVLLDAKRGKWTHKKANTQLQRKMNENWKILVVKNNCHPFKVFILNFIQLPVWLLMTMTIRKFANDVYTGASGEILAALQFLVGGPFWCQNLALPDPTYILPSIITLSTLTSIELNLAGSNALSFSKKIITNFLRLFAVLILFVSSVIPSGVSLFWAATGVCNLIQILLLLSPRVRSFCRIPKTSADLDHPYRHVAYKLGEKCAYLGKFFLRK